MNGFNLPPFITGADKSHVENALTDLINDEMLTTEEVEEAIARAWSEGLEWGTFLDEEFGIYIFGGSECR